WLRSERLQRNNRRGLAGNIRRLFEEREDLVFAFAKLFAQLRRQGARGSVASQTVFFYRKIDVLLPQFGEKGGNGHSSSSSRRPPVPDAVFVVHVSMSIASARVLSWRLSKRWRNWMSTLNAARIFATAFIASKECPPRSKKLSSAPMLLTFNKSD